MQWFNEPPSWQAQGDTLTVTAGAKTDFWRKTHYGFIRDSGHFYYDRVQGDFELEVKISGKYEALYDQAGIMVRLDENHWIKSGIEFVNGVQQISAVVTHEFSDWSVTPLPDNPASIWLRLTRHGDAIEIHCARDEDSGVARKYTMFRMAYFVPQETVSVGLMCAAPDGDGFTTVFEKFTLQKA